MIVNMKMQIVQNQLLVNTLFILISSAVSGKLVLAAHGGSIEKTVGNVTTKTDNNYLSITGLQPSTQKIRFHFPILSTTLRSTNTQVMNNGM